MFRAVFVEARIQAVLAAVKGRRYVGQYGGRNNKLREWRLSLDDSDDDMSGQEDRITTRFRL